MKVSSSDSTEGRSFATFMGPSLVTNLAAQRARDTSAPPDWTRTAALSSSSNPCLPRPTLVSDLSNPAVQVRMASKTSQCRTAPRQPQRHADGRTAWCTARKAPTDWWQPILLLLGSLVTDEGVGPRSIWTRKTPAVARKD